MEVVDVKARDQHRVEVAVVGRVQAGRHPPQHEQALEDNGVGEDARPGDLKSIVEWPRKVRDGTTGRGRGGQPDPYGTRARPRLRSTWLRPSGLSLPRIVALVPVRGLEGAKARLRGARRGGAAGAGGAPPRPHGRGRGGTAAVTEIVAVSPDPDTLALARALGAAALAQDGGGLNEGLARRPCCPRNRRSAPTPFSWSRATSRPSPPEELSRIVGRFPRPRGRSREAAGEEKETRPRCARHRPRRQRHERPPRGAAGGDLVPLRRRLASSPRGRRPGRGRRLPRDRGAARVRPRHPRRPPRAAEAVGHGWPPGRGSP